MSREKSAGKSADSEQAGLEKFDAIQDRYVKFVTITQKDLASFFAKDSKRPTSVCFYFLRYLDIAFELKHITGFKAIGKSCSLLGGHYSFLI